MDTYATVSPSPKPVRLKDVAEKAGVSAAVVSAVLRGRTAGEEGGSTIGVSAATAQRIKRLALQMGYRPNVLAQQLKGRPSDVIGVLIGAESTPANFNRLAALERATFACNRRLMIGQFHRDSGSIESYAEDFLSRGIDLLACFHNPPPVLDRDGVALLQRFKGVVFQTAMPWPGALCVDVDRPAGVMEAVAHLVHRGRQRIALVLGEHWDKDLLMKDRYDGYRAGLAAAGRTVDPKLIWSGNKFHTFEQAVQAVETVVVNGRADAIVASNDFWAMLLMKALRRLGLQVPTDVAVVGFDNLEVTALLDPALTTIDQNNEAFAQAMLDLLLEAAAGPIAADGRKRMVKPRLVVREST